MRISVYITSYNQKEYLAEAIESVLAQTLRPFQIVVVDDCSTDGSQGLIAGYASRYGDLFTPVFHTTNQGIARARIAGVQAATGDYVSHVDGDDRFLPRKLESEVSLLEQNRDAQIAFSDYYYITADGTRTGSWAETEKPPQGDVFHRTFARDFPKRGLFRNELVNRAAWERIGFYDPQLSLYEDYEMLIRLTKHLRVAYHDEPMSEYRIHEAGLSRARAVDHLAALNYILKKNRPLLDDPVSDAGAQVEIRLREWMAWIARRGVDEAIRDAQEHRGRAHALRQYLRIVRAQPSYRIHHKTLLRIILPDAAYESLRVISRKARQYTRSVRS